MSALLIRVGVLAYAVWSIVSDVAILAVVAWKVVT